MTLQLSAPAAPSYLQILKSTALIGGSSVVIIAFAVLRNKIAAILLGPAGIGLMGLYASILDLTQSLASLGIPSSGVRQIAQASGTQDRSSIALTTAVLRRVSLALGLLGAMLLLVFSAPVARITFGDDKHTVGVALLSIAVFCRLVSGGQLALLQGLRRIAQLARINMLAALLGTLVTIPLIFFFGQDGVAPSLAAVAVVGMLVSWWHARSVEVDWPALRSDLVRREVSSMLKLGLAFLASGLLTAASAYAIRLIVLKADGALAAGLYQSAWVLGGLYAGFVLQAMGADFYPRLTAVCNDDAECERLVNEQAQIGMLLAGPGLLGTLTVAPLVIAIFYTPDFSGAVNVLRWICLGMMLRIVAWPMGFIVVAKGAQTVFFVTELAASVVHVGLAWLLTPYFGVVGAGAAFCGLYVWHNVVIYLVVRRMSGFRWSHANLKLAAIFLPAAAFVFSVFLALPFWPATAAGLTVTAASGLYCFRELLRLLPPEQLPIRLPPWLPKLLRLG